MAGNFFNKVNLSGHIQNGFGNMNMGTIPQVQPLKIDSMDETQSNSFKGVMSGIVNNLNQSLNAPGELLHSAMVGNNDVDIHDVMTAMAKAEMSVNVATQVTSKVIQSYDKIMQISV